MATGTIVCNNKYQISLLYRCILLSVIFFVCFSGCSSTNNTNTNTVPADGNDVQTTNNAQSDPSCVSNDCKTNEANQAKVSNREADALGYIDDRDNTPLILAVKKGDLTEIESLLSRGADINLAMWAGHTPLITAIRQDKPEIAKLLIQKGADVNHSDIYLKTPLMYALDMEYDDLVQMLIAAGADVNARHQDGRTPLMFSQSIENTEILLEAGADPYTRDNRGRNVLHYAADSKTLLLFMDHYNVPNIPGEDFDHSPIIPETFSKDQEMLDVFFQRPHRRYTQDLFLSLCGKQTRKIYVDLDKLDERTDEALDRYVKSIVEAKGEKFIGIDRRIGFDDDDKLTVYVGNKTNAVNFASMILSIEIRDIENCTDQTGRTPLMYAANGGNPDTVQWLIRHGAKVNAKSNNGITPLLVAAESLPEVVDTLIQKKADVNAARTDSKLTPLIAAASNGHTEAVKSLIKAGAKVNATTNDGYSALMEACMGGHTDVVKVLLDAKADPNLATYKGETPLMTASYQGHSEIVKLLLGAKANANQSDKNGKTALMYATKADIVTMLLQAGANAKAIAKDGTTPLMHSYKSYGMLEAYLFGSDKIINPESQIIQILIDAGTDVNAQNDTGETALYLASRGGDLESVKCLIAAKANVNTKTKYGETPLHAAKSAEITKALLAAGADAKAIDSYKHTPLHYTSNADMARALLEAGAEVDAKDEYGYTPLLNEVMGTRMDADIVKVLVDAGANIHATQSDRPTDRQVIHFANTPEIIDILIAAGADINALSGENWTPLHNNVAYLGSAQTAKKMIAAGANVNAKDNKGRTPLMMAAKANRINRVKVLLEAGANVNDVDENGYSALMLAACTDKGERSIQNSPMQVITELIKAGADINMISNDGKTAFDCVAHRDYASARALVFAGVETNNFTELFKSAAYYGDTQIIQALAPKVTDKSSDASNNIVLIASSWGHVNALRALLEAGFNPNAKYDGKTALTITSSLSCVKVLVEAGADINLKDDYGMTPLQNAEKRGLYDIMRFLKSAPDASKE